MNKRASSSQLSLSDYYLAVYPLSLLFQRDYKTKFLLYFEKSLQIISKYETPTATIKRQESVYFNPPEQIQHFRIQSDKNLEFQWSLYIRRIDIDGDNEEFAQGQKINLKNEWNQFKNSKQNSFESVVNFSRMKSKFVYLVLIANSNKELLDLAKKYSANSIAKVFTNNQKVVTIQQEPEKQSESPPKAQKSSQSPPKTQNIQESQNLKSQLRSSIIDINYDVQSPTKPPARNQSVLETPQDNREGIFVTFGQKLDPKSNNLNNGEDGHHKLTYSDIEISNQIQNQVNNKEKSIKGLSQEFETPPEEVQPNQYQQEGTIRMTTSTLLNEKGEALIPFYKNKKAILLVIGLVLLLILSTFFIGGTKQLKKKDKRKIKQPQQTKKSKQKSKTGKK